MNISGVILSYNEEETIVDAIKSLDFCNEIIVVDDESADNTVNLAKKHGVKVLVRPLNDDFSSQRNFALSKAKFDWIMFLDADETIPDKLKAEIKNEFTNNNDVHGYYFKRHDVFGGKELTHGENGSIRLLRLANKKYGKWSRAVHEVWNVSGKVKTFNNPIIHNSHMNIKGFVDSINYFSHIHALENQKEGKKSDLIKIIFWPILKFVNSYFFSLGFLDGIEGFIYAVFMGLHSFMSWSELWLIQKKSS